jgi:hypothetical protein
MRRMIGVALALMLLTAVRVLAQLDLSGSWPARNYGDALANRPGPGPNPVEFMGIPLNDSARMRALLHSPSEISMPDRMCSLYSPVYMLVGPFGLKIWNETEPRNGSTVAWRIGAWEDMASWTIWMDGRPRPSASAPHEDGGFNTGEWEHDVLTTYTTHMKRSVIRRNGIVASDRATMRTRFFPHGDLLTVTARIEDPVSLTTPLYLTRTFQRAAVPPIPTVGQPCIPADEGVPRGAVPHYLPGQNPFLDEIETLYHIPKEVVLGGAETMYPEIRKTFKDRFTIPEKCQRACGGPGAFPLRSN